MDFGNYYNMLINEFVNTSDFTILNEEEGFFNWPNSSGVYVIWEKKEFQEKELIYIGMTGKFLKNINGILNFNNAKFKSRVNRWTPYRFCENINDKELRYHFRFGPKESNTSLQANIKYDIDAYHTSIPYKKIEIHCFHVNNSHPIYTPVLLESLLLTKYLKSTGMLPPGNNSL